MIRLLFSIYLDTSYRKKLHEFLHRMNKSVEKLTLGINSRGLNMRTTNLLNSSMFHEQEESDSTHPDNGATGVKKYSLKK